MSKIKAIIFDLWNTIAFNKGSLINPLDQLERKLQLDRKFDYKEVERGFMIRKYKSIVKAISALCKHLGMKPNTKNVRDLLDIWEASQRGFSFFKDVEPVINRFRKKGYKIGLISNTDSFSIKLFFDSGFKNLFDATVFSYDVGCLKPNERMFKTVLEKLEVKPEESIMIGDNLKDDVIPAVKLGMKSILIKRDLRKEAGIPSWKEPGNYMNTISTLKELPKFIE